jgi:hypothetical protein
VRGGGDRWAPRRVAVLGSGIRCFAGTTSTRFPVLQLLLCSASRAKMFALDFFWRFPFLFFSLFFIFEQFSLFLSSVLFRLRTGVRVLSPPLWVRRVPPLSRSHGRGRLLVYCSVGTPCLGPPDSESCRRRGFPARCVRRKREPRGRDL